jgi:transcriptional regulator with XRE-family HTH domain
MYQRIRDLREDHDLRQKEVASYLNCSQVCYSNYERGNRDVPTDILINLSQYYNTSVDYLLGLTDDPAPYPRKRRPARNEA